MLTVNFPTTSFPKVYLLDDDTFSPATTEERSSLLPRGVPGSDAGVLTRVQITNVGRRLDHQLKLGHHCKRQRGSVGFGSCASV